LLAPSEWRLKIVQRENSPAGNIFGLVSLICIFSKSLELQASALSISFPAFFLTFPHFSILFRTLFLASQLTALRRSSKFTVGSGFPAKGNLHLTPFVVLGH